MVRAVHAWLRGCSHDTLFYSVEPRRNAELFCARQGPVVHPLHVLGVVRVEALLRRKVFERRAIPSGSPTVTARRRMHLIGVI